MNIALVGPRKSGKSTAAEALINNGYTRLSLADPVKDAAVMMVNALNRPPLHFPVVERLTIDIDKATFRPLLEWIGSTFGRDYFDTPDRWINMFSNRLDYTPGPIVCDDVRFPNEAAALREMGFLIVWINRPAKEREESLAEAGEPMGRMPSEATLLSINPDFMIFNNRTVDDLHRLVLLLARKEAA